MVKLVGECWCHAEMFQVLIDAPVGDLNCSMLVEQACLGARCREFWWIHFGFCVDSVLSHCIAYCDIRQGLQQSPLYRGSGGSGTWHSNRPLTKS